MPARCNSRSRWHLCQHSLSLECILTFGSRSNRLHNPHRCRSRPRIAQAAGWKPQASPLRWSPEVSSSQQCNSPRWVCLGHCSLALLRIPTAGSKPDHLHSLHRCRSLPRRSQEASWKLQESPQPRSPDMGDGNSRSPPHLCQRSLALQDILTVRSNSGHLHSLHRCRNRPHTLQVADWRPQGSPQPRNPEVACCQE
jgi:hypothetical protein